MNFVLTQWVDDFDYDGLTNTFSVLGEFCDLAEAQAYLDDSVSRLAVEQLEEHNSDSLSSWHLMGIEGKERPPWYQVNKGNKVVNRRSFKIGDGSGFNSIYTYLELIAIPENVEVDETLFDVVNCGYEVKSYFARRQKSGKQAEA
jgi:hypothetical protein